MSAGQGTAIAERFRRRFAELRRSGAPYQAIADSVANGQVMLLETADADTPYEQPASKLRSADVRAGDLVLAFSVADDQGGQSFYVAGTIDDGTERSLQVPSQVIGTGATPALTKLTAAGTTATVAGQSGGTDTVGLIELIPGGTGIASGAQVLMTFATPRPSVNYVVMLTAATTAARTAGSNIGPTNRTTTTWQLTSDTPLSSGSTYRWMYWIAQYG